METTQKFRNLFFIRRLRHQYSPRTSFSTVQNLLPILTMYRSFTFHSSPSPFVQLLIHPRLPIPSRVLLFLYPPGYRRHGQFHSTLCFVRKGPQHNQWSRPEVHDTLFPSCARTRPDSNSPDYIFLVALAYIAPHQSVPTRSDAESTQPAYLSNAQKYRRLACICRSSISNPASCWEDRESGWCRWCQWWWWRPG